MHPCLNEPRAFHGGRVGDDAEGQVQSLAQPAHTPLPRRFVAAATIGNALEFYDFITYAFFAIQIGHAFFPGKSAYGSLMPSLATFGAGFVTRPIGGLVIGQEVARQLGLRFIFVEKEEGKLELRRGFKITPGEKTLIIEDVVTKGGRVQETIDIVRAHGGHVTGVAVIVDRSNGAVNFGVPFASLISFQVELFKPDRLPPDLAAIPAIKPGSK